MFTRAAPYGYKPTACALSTQLRLSHQPRVTPYGGSEKYLHSDSRFGFLMKFPFI